MAGSLLQDMPGQDTACGQALLTMEHVTKQFEESLRSEEHTSELQSHLT